MNADPTARPLDTCPQCAGPLDWRGSLAHCRTCHTDAMRLPDGSRVIVASRADASSPCTACASVAAAAAERIEGDETHRTLAALALMLLQMRGTPSNNPAMIAAELALEEPARYRIRVKASASASGIEIGFDVTPPPSPEQLRAHARKLATAARLTDARGRPLA